MLNQRTSTNPADVENNIEATQQLSEMHRAITREFKQLTGITLREQNLSRSDWMLIEAMVALRTKSKRLMRVILLHGSRVGREHLAFNATVSMTVLRQLASDKSAQIRLGVVSNPKTPIWIIEGLANDPDETVRQAVTSLGLLPRGDSEQFCGQSNDDAARRAGERFGVTLRRSQ